MSDTSHRRPRDKSRELAAERARVRLETKLEVPVAELSVRDRVALSLLLRPDRSDARRPR